MKYIFVALFILGSCQSFGPAKNQRSLGYFSSSNELKNRLNMAKDLHDLGDIEAAIAMAKTIVDNEDNSETFKESYEYLIKWLLELQKRSEAKRVASYYLLRFPKNKNIDQIVSLFDEQNIIDEAMVLEDIIENNEAVKSSDEEDIFSLNN